MNFAGRRRMNDNDSNDVSYIHFAD